MLAEYLLGNPRHRRYGSRRHHNPAFGMGTLMNPVPLLTQAAAGVGGVVAPILVGNLIIGFVGPSFPMLVQPGIVGSAIRAGVRIGVVALGDPFVRGIRMIDHNAWRVGNAIGIGGSFLMDLLGRPLIIGPGDSALSLNYLFGGVTGGGAAGAGAYFRRSMTGAGAYFRRSMTGTGETGDVSALVPLPRLRGTGSFSRGGTDLFNTAPGSLF